MRHWFKDQHFRSLLKNSSYLAVSRIVAAIAQLVSVSLAAHALGVLCSAHSFSSTATRKAVSGIAKFQSWQLIVRYGGESSTEKMRISKPRPASPSRSTHQRRRRNAGRNRAASVRGRWVGIQPDQLFLAMLYCTLLPTMASATSTRCSPSARSLRPHQLADTVSANQPGDPRLIVYLAGAPFIAYVAAWYISTLTGDLYDVFIAWRELRRRGLIEGIRPTLRPTTSRAPGALQSTST